MEFEVEGVEELQAQLEALPEKVQSRLFKAALRAGAEVVAAAITFDAPSKTGRMVSGIKIVGSSSGGEPSVSVTVPPPGNLLEYGTKNRGFLQSIFGKGRKEKNNGDVRMPAHPFVKPGFAASREEAYEAVGDVLIESIEKEAFEEE